MLFRTLPVAPDCNKVSENEKTSGNRYIGHESHARVSTSDQDLSLQMNELRAAGCKPIFTDKVGGAKSRRPAVHRSKSGYVLRVARKKTSHMAGKPLITVAGMNMNLISIRRHKICHSPSSTVRTTSSTCLMSYGLFTNPFAPAERASLVGPLAE
jgi:hypothetical protein